MQYGQQYSITYNSAATVTHACLIRLAAVTHGFDQDQRRVPLKVTQDEGSILPTIVVDAPANGNIAPPGYYMLFILYEYARNKYVPCTMAAYVRIGP